MRSLESINAMINEEVYKLYGVRSDVIEIIRRELEEIPRELTV